MGKPEAEQPLPSGVSSEDPQQNAEARCRCSCSGIWKFVGLRCIFVLLFSVAVFLSALFWLPPFLRYADQKNLLADSKYKDHDIVASFFVNKSVSLLEDNILNLTDDISEEIQAPSIKVVILSLDSFPGSNTTQVVFAVDPDDKYSEMSSTAISLIKASFTSLVVRQSTLHLTPSLFGDPSFFQVLKFKGGITIIPIQKAFLLQKVQTLFNFTLNFSINQIQSNFDELTSQLKSGLHLAPYENLYVILSNSEGSTVAAPTIVQSSVVLAVGIPPSTERLKQLAQTIMGPHSRNLGLNHTEFGRVKQVRLSSILQHSLHGSDGNGPAWSPSPTPLPHPHHHHHHHHHHHQHHHRHHDAHLSPATPPASETGDIATPPEVGSPTPAKSKPAPGKSSQAQPPNCRFGYRKRPTHNTGKPAHPAPAVAPIGFRMRSTHNTGKPAHLAPAVAPIGYRMRSTHNAGKPTQLAPAVAPIAPNYPVASPKSEVERPAHVSHSVPALAPLPNVAFAHAEPPPKNEPAAEPSNPHSHGPSPSPSSAGCLRTVQWASLVYAVLMLHVLHA